MGISLVRRVVLGSMPRRQRLGRVTPARRPSPIGCSGDPEILPRLRLTPTLTIDAPHNWLYRHQVYLRFLPSPGQDVGVIDLFGDHLLMSDYVRWLSELGMDDVGVVGGKNASLGEMIQHLTAVGVRVPGGFATTAQAYRDFLAVSGLDRRISAELESLDVDDIAALSEAGPKIRASPESILSTASWTVAAPSLK
mgnify:CR=1 FL=1